MFSAISAAFLACGLAALEEFAAADFLARVFFGGFFLADAVSLKPAFSICSRRESDMDMG
jgi:hypothetical protein